jgi:hypothetical protein
MLTWTPKHAQARYTSIALDILGFLPEMVSDDDPRPAWEQFNSNYQHGGGWRPFPGFTMSSNGNLSYPGDPPIRCLFEAKLRLEVLRLYEHEWVAIIQPNGSFEVCRMD